MLGKLEQILKTFKIVCEVLYQLAAYLIKVLVEQGVITHGKEVQNDRSSS